MANLPLKLACGPYDRMEGLRYGAVLPEGIDIEYLAITPPHAIFARMVANEEFDVCEMSAALYLIERSKGRFPFVAIPVFPSRVFRHGNIYINRNADISEPRDLEGKRVGLQEFRQTAALWARGILRDEYGVDTDAFNWVEGGTNTPRKANPQIDIRPDRSLFITHLEEGDTLSAALEAGRIDAMLGAQRPMSFDSGENVIQLFPDYRARERDYFKRTGIFPIMHTMIFREAVYAKNPWIAKSIFAACEKSKVRADQEMRFSSALRFMTPWLLDDIVEMDAVFGGDAWPYGLQTNRPHLATMQRYLVEEGFLSDALPLDELFVSVE
jgi:4,5-dihydroxyphthalate decarboxylase